MTPDSRKRGRLKIFMGFAAGVGKTYQMLEEARELKSAGVDVVIGYFEPHGRKDTIAKTEGLETVPRKMIEYRGAVFEEMDSAAILARRPEIALVDEYPHTNVPGSERNKRWEDVEALLDAGVGVFATMNIQHLESLNDQVAHITGIRVRETVPDWVIERADEVVMVDLTPRALLHRLERGVVYKPDKAERARQNFFKESTLVALRELALRQTAHEVQQRFSGAAAEAGAPEHPARTRNRILALITPDPETAAVIRRASRMSGFLNSECFALAVQPPGGLERMAPADREAIDRHLNFARNLRIETRVIEGADPARALIDFCRRNAVAQIYLARPRRRPWLPMSRDMVQRIVALAKDMQVVIVAGREPRPERRQAI